MIPVVLRIECAYCETAIPYVELEVRNGKLVCRDVEACDARDDANHDGHLVGEETA